MAATTASDRPSSARRVLVVTGDHGRLDPTKWDGRYTDDDLAFHRRMRDALESLPGYAFDFLVEHDLLLERLLRDPPELVFNLCDTGFRNDPTRELHVPALCELVGVPYTGAPPACMVLCYDKAVVRHLAGDCGVPTPREHYVPPEARLDDLPGPFPAFVKPAEGDGSVGISRDAVVHDAAAARAQLERLRHELPGRAALLQEFLSGPEYGLALLGNPATGLTPLPPLEVDYTALPPELPPILAFESKTGPATPYESVRVRRARLADDAVAELRRRAERLFARLQCRDYARFDFRTDADGEIRLLEVNPNPAWSTDAKLAIMAGFAGIGYPDLLARILAAAQLRAGLTPPS